jgi:hypothetical protein
MPDAILLYMTICQKSHIRSILEKLALHTVINAEKYVHTSNDYNTAIKAFSMIEEEED